MAFRATDYLITPGDLLRLLAAGWHLLLSMGARDWCGVGLLATVWFVCADVIALGTETTLFLLFAMSVWYWKIPARVAMTGALVCLVTIPLFLFLFQQDILLKGEIIAEQVAVWAFYFLVIGVIRQISEPTDTAALSEVPDARHDDDTNATPRTMPPGRPSIKQTPRPSHLPLSPRVRSPRISSHMDAIIPIRR